MQVYYVLISLSLSSFGHPAIWAMCPFCVCQCYIDSVVKEESKNKCAVYFALFMYQWGHCLIEYGLGDFAGCVH